MTLAMEQQTSVTSHIKKLSFCCLIWLFTSIRTVYCHTLLLFLLQQSCSFSTLISLIYKWVSLFRILFNQAKLWGYLLDSAASYLRLLVQYYDTHSLGVWYMQRSVVVLSCTVTYCQIFWLVYLWLILQDAPTPPVAATIFFGANDAALLGRTSERQHVPLEEYKENLRRIIQHLKV